MRYVDANTVFSVCMERIKFKKEMLLEMRTDGEITKQEFLDQRKKLDKELQELQAEYDSKAYNPVIEMDQPEWGKIQTALEEILDLSQPTPSPDLIRKFVAQIVPEGKTNFQWHLNLDGNQTTHVGMTVEGRKNKAVVSFAAEGTCSPLAFGAVIEYPTLCRAAADKNAYLSAMQDRLLSRANRTPCKAFIRPSKEGRIFLYKLRRSYSLGKRNRYYRKSN